ncbi:MAG: DUF1934 domain-containing protein [Alistipes sp.]|nr:DUF1934 domain-containing protein [Alistipes sp.]
MTNDVIVTVRGIQIGLETQDDIEVISPGKYYERNNKRYIRYEEQQEDMSGTVINIIKIGPEGVEIVKKGLVGAQMVFREKEKINTCYETPYGIMMITIYTDHVQYTVNEDRIEVNLAYNIEMNGEALSDAKVYIKVEPRTGEGLRLV